LIDYGGFDTRVSDFDKKLFGKKIFIIVYYFNLYSHSSQALFMIFDGGNSTRGSSGVARGLGQRRKNVAEGGPLATVGGPLANTQKKS